MLLITEECVLSRSVIGQEKDNVESSFCGISEPHFHLSSTEIAWEWKVNILPLPPPPPAPILEDQSLKSWKTILAIFSILCAKIIFTRELWWVRRAYPSMHQCANASVIAVTSVLLLISLVNAVQRGNKEICRFRKSKLNRQQKICI